MMSANSALAAFAKSIGVNSSWEPMRPPLTMIFSSILIIFMDRGASEISTSFGLNHSYSDILTGIILFFIIGCEFFISYRLQFRKKDEKEGQ